MARPGCRHRQQLIAAQAQFTGAAGKYVPLKETIASFKEILAGKYDSDEERDGFARRIAEAIR